MILDKNYDLNMFGRVADPRDVFMLFKERVSTLQTPLKIKIHKPFKYLCYSNLRATDIDFSVNGKGPTELIAIVSAYAEFIERFSAFAESWHETMGGLNLLRQSTEQRELFGKIFDHSYLKDVRTGRQKAFENPVDIKFLMQNSGFSDRQIELIKEKSVFTRTWVPAKAIFENDKEYYVPVHLVKLINGTNGLSTGVTLTEAIMHGVFEVLERYVTLEFLRRRQNIPTIDPTTINDEKIQASLEYFKENDIEVILKDFSLNLKIPAIGILTFNKKLNPNHRAYNTLKVGVATTGKNAIVRALTERLQGTSFAEERLLGESTEEEKDYALKELLNYGRLSINLDNYRNGDVTPFKDWYYRNTKDVFILIKKIIKKLNTKLFIINYTHKLLKIPVVQIIIPTISDTMDLFTGSSRSLSHLGGVDEPLLRIEKNIGKLYETFFEVGSNDKKF